MKTVNIISGIFSTINHFATPTNDYSSASQLPYFQFNKQDYDKLLCAFDDDKEIIYCNQNGEFLKLKLSHSTLGKKTFKKTLSPKRIIRYFFYDEQNIQLKASRNAATDFFLNYTLAKKPLFFEPYNVSENSIFKATIQLSTWNGASEIIIDYAKPKTTLTINNVTYDAILIFESGNFEAKNHHNVNRIYFDIHKGIVGFDDLNGMNWRLKN